MGYWIGRAVVAPSPGHGLYVAGPIGTVLGMVDVQPARDVDLARDAVAEVTTLYVDPTVWRRHLGSALLEAAVGHAAGTGRADVRLWVAEANDGARAFYERAGWEPDGATQRFYVIDGVSIDEVRYRSPA